MCSLWTAVQTCDRPIVLPCPTRHFRRHGRVVGGGVVGQQGRELGGELAEGLGAVVRAAHQAQLVLDQRMLRFNDFHRPSSRGLRRSHEEEITREPLLQAACCWRGPSRSERLTSCSTSCSSSLPNSNRSEEHTSELKSLMRISYDVFCLKKKKTKTET